MGIENNKKYGLLAEMVLQILLQSHFGPPTKFFISMVLQLFIWYQISHAVKFKGEIVFLGQYPQNQTNSILVFVFFSF